MLLEVEGLTAMHSKLRDVSFNVHKGEIVGLARPGRLRPHRGAGKYFRRGYPQKRSHPPARQRGEEPPCPRRDQKQVRAAHRGAARPRASLAFLDIQENTTISSLKKYKVKGLYLSRKKMEESTEWSIRAMRIKTPSQDTKIRSLSGRNQQKVILGRWLLTDPRCCCWTSPPGALT